MNSTKRKDLAVIIVIVASIIVLVWGYNFLKGQDLFSDQNDYVMRISDSKGIVKGTVIYINGVGVGSVTNLTLNPDHSIMVQLTIPDDIEVYSNTIAEIYSPDLINGNAIQLLYSMPNGKLLENHDTLIGRYQRGILDQLSPKVNELLPDIQSSLSNISAVTQSLNSTLNPSSQLALQNSIQNLNTVTQNLAVLSGELAENTYYINKIMANASNFTSNLSQNNDEINASLKNIKGFSDQLVNSNIQNTISDLNTSINSLNNVLASLDTTEGTLGLLLHDRGLYYRLNSTTESLNKLLDDIRNNPNRYINVSLIGGKSQ